MRESYCDCINLIKILDIYLLHNLQASSKDNRWAKNSTGDSGGIKDDRGHLYKCWKEKTKIGGNIGGEPSI